MRLLRKIFLALSLGLIAATAGASSANPENGKEYKVLARPQPAEMGKKVEVIEFFGYFCPHCRAFEPYLADWVKKQGENILFKRIHVNFHDLVTQQKLYYTLEALGKTEEFQSKVFDAFHVERNQLRSDADIMAFVLKNGLDKQKFFDVYNSFSIQSKLSRTTQLQEACQIGGVPTIIIDGRYVTSIDEVRKALGLNGPEQTNIAETLKVMDSLVAKVQKEKNLPESTASTQSAPPAKAGKTK
ncbi:MAG: thiol:disulfide interchange protein DsbA/DsbL [Pseudomonadota bacterium]